MIKELKYKRIVSEIENVLSGLIVNDFVEYASYYIIHLPFRVIHIDNTEKELHIALRFLNYINTPHILDREMIIYIITKYYKKLIMTL